MINLIMAIVLVVSALILIVMLSEMKDEEKRWENIRWVICDVILAIINLLTYFHNRGD